MLRSVKRRTEVTGSTRSYDVMPNMHLTSPELDPLFPFFLFWGPLCFPLTRQCIFFVAGLPFFQPG